jgi:hypothetical protein
MNYEVIRGVDLAMNLGYEALINNDRGARFYKGSRVIWAIREGWQTADLIDGSYQNHEKFESLEDALRRDL